MADSKATAPDLAKLGKNFRLKQLVPPFKKGDIVPAWAFGPDYPVHLLKNDAIEHCHDPVTVDVPEPTWATSPELPETAPDEALRAENRTLRGQVDDLNGKLAAAEAGRKEALEANGKGSGELKEAIAKLEGVAKSNELLVAENNRLRLEAGMGATQTEVKTSTDEAKGENPATNEPAKPADAPVSTGPGGTKPKHPKPK